MARNHLSISPIFILECGGRGPRGAAEFPPQAQGNGGVLLMGNECEANPKLWRCVLLYMGGFIRHFLMRSAP
jgi:hypothetical protein